jgi:plastocyanin
MPMGVAAAIALVVMTLVLTGCGSSSSSSSSTAAPAKSPANTSTNQKSPTPGPQVVQLKADEGGALKFDRDDVRTLAGKVQLSMSNPSSLRHNIAIKGNGVDEKGPIVGKGGVSIVNVQLKPGDYEFYCSVPGHEQAGMKGTLHVGTS